MPGPAKAFSTYGRVPIGDAAIAVSGRAMAPGSKSWSAVQPGHIFSNTRQ
ncbi:hypothetical protein OG417_46510 [Actinoallomurus sp. NBC_01490]|nr:hypothetical protein [Actinoallomurus sp. NBC_01490]